MVCGDLTTDTPEACNGVDDDCDGSVDEGCTGVLVEISCPAADPTCRLWIYWDSGASLSAIGTLSVTLGLDRCLWGADVNAQDGTTGQWYSDLGQLDQIAIRVIGVLAVCPPVTDFFGTNRYCDQPTLLCP